jgi:hypothetical protein
VRVDGPVSSAFVVDAALAARRDRWSEAVVQAEPRQVRSSPVERSAVSEVPAEAAARVTDGRRQRREQKKRDAGTKTGATAPPPGARTADTARQPGTAADPRVRAYAPPADARPGRVVSITA